MSEPRATQGPLSGLAFVTRRPVAITMFMVAIAVFGAVSLGKLPVDLLPRDILLVATVAFGMCLVAAVYPARRAAALAPAQVLNQDR